VIRGRRFPTCQHCHAVSFELIRADVSHSRRRSAGQKEYRRYWPRLILFSRNTTFTRLRLLAFLIYRVTKGLDLQSNPTALSRLLSRFRNKAPLIS
jgi:hypothetical protein